MKQFLLFAAEDHYPSGGWGDFVGSYDKRGQAEEAGKKTLEFQYGQKAKDWWHVIDGKTGEQVAWSIQDGN